MAEITSNLAEYCYPKYESEVNVSRLTENMVKIEQTMANDTVKKRQVYAFPPDPSLEEVLLVIDVYKKKSNEIQFDSDDKFENFSQLCSGNEYEHCLNARNAGPTNNDNHFNQCMNRFILNYCRFSTKEFQYKHYTTCHHDCKKPLKSKIRTHHNRLLTIKNRVNMTPGSANWTITEQHLKESSLNSCDFAEDAWNTSNQNITTIQIEGENGLIEWLEKIKVSKDKEWKKKQEDKKAERKREDATDADEPKNKRNKTNHNQDNGSVESPASNTPKQHYSPKQITPDTHPHLNWCRRHQGEHLWKNCPTNPYSTKFNPNHPDVRPRSQGNGFSQGGNGQGSGPRSRQGHGGPTHTLPSPNPNATVNQQHFQQYHHQNEPNRPNQTSQNRQKPNSLYDYYFNEHQKNEAALGEKARRENKDHPGFDAWCNYGRPPFPRYT